MVIASKSIPDDLVFPQIPVVEPINWAIRNRILRFGLGCEEVNFPMTCGSDLTGRIMMFCLQHYQVPWSQKEGCGLRKVNFSWPSPFYHFCSDEVSKGGM